MIYVVVIQSCVLSLKTVFCLFSPLIGAPGVRGERAAACFCLAFSCSGAGVEVESLKVKLQGGGGGRGGGHTILWPRWLQTTFPPSCFIPSVTGSKLCCTAALPVGQRREDARNTVWWWNIYKNVCFMLSCWKVTFFFINLTYIGLLCICVRCFCSVCVGVLGKERSHVCWGEVSYW